jgi:hypothetical protein
MTGSDIDEIGRQFLFQLFQQTNGDPAVQVSMYDIGEDLGLDRDAASRVAEELIALQLVEIKTLSGGIGISNSGVEEVQHLFGDRTVADDQVVRLGDTPILDQVQCQVIEQIMGDLKGHAGNFGLDFDSLSELMADVKTIDAQLGSSRPKSAIIGECLRSLKAVLEKIGERESLPKIIGLMGE